MATSFRLTEIMKCLTRKVIKGKAYSIGEKFNRNFGLAKNVNGFLKPKMTTTSHVGEINFFYFSLSSGHVERAFEVIESMYAEHATGY